MATIHQAGVQRHLAATGALQAARIYGSAYLLTCFGRQDLIMGQSAIPIYGMIAGGILYTVYRTHIHCGGPIATKILGCQCILPTHHRGKIIKGH